MPNTMSYAGAGVVAPAVGTSNDEVFTKSVLDHVFLQHNATDTLVGTPTTTATANALVKRDSGGGAAFAGTLTAAAITATGTVAAGTLFGAVTARAATGTATTMIAVQDNTPTNTITLNSDGSAGFAGNVSVLSLTAGSAVVPLVDAVGHVNNAALATAGVDVPHGGTGRVTLPANNLLAGNGTGAANLIAPGAANTVLASTGSAWAPLAITGALFADGSLAFAKVTEGRVVANGANLQLTIGAMKFFDANLNPVIYGGGTYTIPSNQVPTGGNNAWVLVYMSPAGAPGSIMGTPAPVPARPQEQPDAQTLGYCYLRSDATAIYQSDQSTSATGYVEDWRNPWNFGSTSGGGGTFTPPLAVTLGGTNATDPTTARSNLGAAAAGVNGDLTRLTALAQIGTNAYFASGTMGLGLAPGGSAQLETYTTDGTKKNVLVFSNLTAAPPAGWAAFYADTYWRSTDASGESESGFSLFSNNIHIGVGANAGTPIAAVGSAGGVNAILYVDNVGGTGASEHSAFGAAILYRTNDPGNSCATPGRAWMTDFGLQGAIRQRQRSLGGVHSFLNNYFDGSPQGVNTTPAAGTASVQKVHASAAITAGSYTLTWAALTTGAIQFNDTLTTINARLAAAGIQFVATGGPLTTPTDIVLTRTIIGVAGSVTVTPTGITGGTLSMVVTDPGTTGAYFSEDVSIASGGTDTPSGGAWVITQPGNGTGIDANHTVSSTYATDVGIGVVGYSGSTANTYSNATRGFTYGVKVGGRGSNWLTPFSRVGTGLWIGDYDAYGIDIANYHPVNTSAVALRIRSGAGVAQIGNVGTPSALLHLGQVAVGTTTVKAVGMVGATADLATFDASAITNAQVQHIDNNGHLYSSQAANPTTSLGAGAGTGGSVAATVAGTDQKGIITLVTGNVAGTTGAGAVTVLYRTAYAAAPHVVLVPANNIAASLAANQQCWLNATNMSTAGFLIFSNNVALPTNATLQYAYHVL